MCSKAYSANIFSILYIVKLQITVIITDKIVTWTYWTTYKVLVRRLDDRALDIRAISGLRNRLGHHVV